MKHQHTADKTLQDDRARLELDAHDDSPLIESEGAPLAEDTVATEATGTDVVVQHGFLGGAPMPSVMPRGEDPAPHDPMVARDDRPIDD